MELLGASEDASQDLGSYMVATGSGGIEIVEEEFCQYKLACGRTRDKIPAPRSLADVTEVELDAAISGLLKQLNLQSYSQTGVRELSSAIKAEWVKARAAGDNAE
jgi:ABC-type Na+ transport system ATPase subunit NatA